VAKDMKSDNEVKCTKCGSTNHIKAGWGWRNGRKDVQKYRCKTCGKVFVLPETNPAEQ
jgi:transposase-like protein